MSVILCADQIWSCFCSLVLNFELGTVFLFLGFEQCFKYWLVPVHRIYGIWFWVHVNDIILVNIAYISDIADMIYVILLILISYMISRYWYHLFLNICFECNSSSMAHNHLLKAQTLSLFFAYVILSVKCKLRWTNRTVLFQGSRWVSESFWWIMEIYKGWCKRTVGIFEWGLNKISGFRHFPLE